MAYWAYSNWEVLSFLENCACQESKAEVTVSCSDLWVLACFWLLPWAPSGPWPQTGLACAFLSFPDAGCTYVTSSVPAVDLKRLLLTCQSIFCPKISHYFLHTHLKRTFQNFVKLVQGKENCFEVANASVEKHPQKFPYYHCQFNTVQFLCWYKKN